MWKTEFCDTVKKRQNPGVDVFRGFSPFGLRRDDIFKKIDLGCNGFGLP
jgi:hypothetical protein